MAVDPVCGMEASPNPDRTATFEGETYAFCSGDCREFFLEHPRRFVEEPHPHLSERDGVKVPRLPYGRAGGDFDHEIADPTDLAVGDRVTFTKSLDDGDVRSFAEATGDTNALHLNDAFAERTRFGGRLVHGTLVAGLVSAALACFPGVTIYLTQELSFEGPVRIGSELVARCTITESLEGDRYRVETTVETENEVVLSGNAMVLIDPIPDV